MSRTDRSAARARKAFAHAVATHAEAKAQKHAARRVANAERRENAARRADLGALRLEGMEALGWDD